MEIIDKIHTLVKEHSLEISEGVFLTCGDRINIEIYEKDGEVVLDIGSPRLYIKVDQDAPLDKRIKVNLIKPDIDKVILTKTEAIIKLSPLGEVRFSYETPV